ncbi:erythromycin esterase family protein [Nonomuraea longispora]|uniref:erythromycin esterase family protein n=1 Tax=Nonomuraea longispora TaxID=1848320 RepID=UPI001FEA4E9D|nr:erythromycin esterase family protein [Nonomuraea longispora]
MMADNLDAIVAREARRGPTLVFAQNSHLRKDKSSWLLPEGWGPLAGRTLEWWSAGAIIGTRLGDQYAFAATTFGTRGSDVPNPDSLEHPWARTSVPGSRTAGSEPGAQVEAYQVTRSSCRPYTMLKTR